MVCRSHLLRELRRYMLMKDVIVGKGMYNRGRELEEYNTQPYNEYVLVLVEA